MTDEDFIETKGGSALKAMLSFFTIIPVNVDKADVDSMERSFHLVPIIGALYAFIVFLICSVPAQTAFGGPLCAGLILFIVIAGTRFLHFDGLVDFGDGMVCPKDREGCINAMKDSRVGAGGIGVALIVTLLTFSIYISMDFALILIAPVAEILVKNSMVTAAAFGEPGNGMAGGQVRQTTRKSMYISTLISAGFVALFCVLGSFAAFNRFDWQVLVIGLVGLVASLFIGYIMAHMANRKFGMVNGDILGATNEISRAFSSLFMVIAFGVLYLI